ncbi:MAG: segregation and condensation protein A [Alphaproteobacteria bacterium]
MNSRLQKDKQDDLPHLEKDEENAFASSIEFEEVDEGDALLLDLEGFEGPIDLLLMLARDQKVDLAQISVLKLAKQYLDFIRNAQQLRLEIAADYLVMAAWLAFLKSKLLIPVIASDEEGSGKHAAVDLAFQLQRLDAMRTASRNLFSKPLLGSERFLRGKPEARLVEETTEVTCTLFDLLKAYARQHTRAMGHNIELNKTELYSFEQAISRMRAYLGKIPDWSLLQSFLPDEMKESLFARSAIANTFLVTLQMVRRGELEMQQDGTFEPIFLRSTESLFEKSKAEAHLREEENASTFSDAKQEPEPEKGSLV